MNQIKKLRSRIENDWSGSSTLPVVLGIFDRLLEKQSFYFDSFLTLMTFEELTKKNFSNTSVFWSRRMVIESVNYLLDPSINVLKVRYEFIDDYCTSILTPDDIIEADSDGFLVHPETGKVVDNYKESIVLTFHLSECVAEAEIESA
ncbi:hypothetical protein [Shewanella sp. AC34-MNA-CIBAN-0136]|jgi:hypothetical protein|uniref:hypothetical protein n=1 Tax=Shewanella sp. AC34-MNA-CIBAN-0136 TaxID=3140463 RepID=UPI00331E916C